MKLTLAFVLFSSACCGAVLHHRDRAYVPSTRAVDEAARALAPAPGEVLALYYRQWWRLNLNRVSNIS